MGASPSCLRTGGGWTIERLRGVLASLLCRDRVCQEAFDRRFDEFFDPALGIRDGAIVVGRVLAELRELWSPPLAPDTGPTEPAGSIPEVSRPPAPPRLWRVWLGICAALFIDCSRRMVSIPNARYGNRSTADIERRRPTTAPTATAATAATTATTPVNHPPASLPPTPVIKTVIEGAGTEAAKWRAPAWGAGLLLLVALVYGAWLRYLPSPAERPAARVE